MAGFVILSLLSLFANMVLGTSRIELPVPDDAWYGFLRVSDPLAGSDSDLNSGTPISTSSNLTNTPWTGTEGTNNSVLIDALRSFHGTDVGVCVLDLNEEVSSHTLQTFHDAGVRGIRANYGNSVTDEEITADVVKAAKIAQMHDWVVQIWAPISAFKALHCLVEWGGAIAAFKQAR
ncbi:hypothetical protein BDW66DRAFT_154400 [Aspergillus desertorum]